MHSALVGFSSAAPRAAMARKMREMRRGNIAPSKSVGGILWLRGISLALALEGKVPTI